MTRTSVLSWMLLLIATTIRFAGQTAAAAAASDGDDDFSHTLMDQLNAMMEEVWPDIARTVGGGHFEPAGDAMAAIAARSRGGSVRSRMSDGFFYRKKLPADKSKTTTEAATAASTATIGTDRTVFGTESECVSAATADGQWRRHCVCYTTDYLDGIGQRLDEPSEVDGPPAAGLFDCTYYKAVPAVLVVRTATSGGDDEATMASSRGDDDEVTTASYRGDDEVTTASSRGDDEVTTASSRADDEVTTTAANVDFEMVADYRLQTTSENDHYRIHYGFVGSDMIIRCLDGDGITDPIAWKYKSVIRKTKSTVSGTDVNELSILGLDPADSKNYTCSTGTDSAKKDGTLYTHHVIAVEKPIYEIRGKATYKTSDGGVCTREMIGPMRKQLSAFVRTEMCPEGSSRYACMVAVETVGCAEEGKTLEIEYSVTLNELSDFLAKLRTNAIGRNVLYYQQVVARIFNVFTVNFDKALSVQIMSRLSPVDVRFTPDYERTTIKTVVSCAPGFGIREVFCAACPPHHYSPANSAECFKCPSGFHQPNAGSEKCTKCPNVFASGCYVDEVSTTAIYGLIAIFVFVVVLFVVASYFCCCRRSGDDKKSSGRKSKNRSSSTLLPTHHKKSDSKDRTKKHKLKSIGRSLKSWIGGKPVHKIIIPKLPFENLHEMFSPHKKPNVPGTF